MALANFTADSLNKTSVCNKEIYDIFVEIMHTINSEILEAKETGAPYLNTMITDTFSVSNMSHEDAKREIHFMILRNLYGRHFRVQIKDIDGGTRMFIAWFTKADLDRMKKQVAFINYCKKPFDKRTPAESRVIIDSLKDIKPLTRSKNKDTDDGDAGDYSD